MVSVNTLCKNILNVKSSVIEDCNFFSDTDGVKHIHIKARPNKWHENDCRSTKGVSIMTANVPSRTYGGDLTGEACWWRWSIGPTASNALSMASSWLMFPGHTRAVALQKTLTSLLAYLPRSTVSEYMRIDWETVGRCVHRTLNDIEPERSRRLDNLVNIGIDETSYKKGHKYITVIVNHDTNTVVWAAQGHGKGVLTQFYRQLTPEQLSSIKVVTGDGAKWITECVNEFPPDCERCIDPFHVVEWAMEALDEVRREVWREAYSEAVQLAKQHPRGKGRPKADDAEAAIVKDAKAKAEVIKNSAYALGKAPEHLTEDQCAKVAMMAENNKRLYRAYRMKETLRLLLKIKGPQEAQAALKHWLWWTSHSRIPAFKELYQKIKRHREHILNTIRLGMRNTRIEATNNKIKLIVRKAYCFRNIQNMLDMVYLVCSDLKVPLPNRKLTIANTGGGCFSPTITPEEPFLLYLKKDNMTCWKILTNAIK